MWKKVRCLRGTAAATRWRSHPGVRESLEPRARRAEEGARLYAMLRPCNRFIVRTVDGGTVGQGSFGVVRTAYDRLTGEHCAVKRVPMSSGAPDPASHESVLEEARILRSLHHPNICRVIEAWESGDACICIALELCVLGDLAKVLCSRKVSLPTADVASVAHGLLRALQYVHGKRVLHRDIKPANVLIAADGTVKLTDFGVSRRLASTHMLASTSVGSPCYMAPELHEETEYGSAADIWSLGCTLHECCSLRPAFSAPNPIELARRIVDGRPTSRLPLHMSTRLRRLIELMMQRDPSRRLDASDLLRSPPLQYLLRTHSPPSFVRHIAPIAAVTTPSTSAEEAAAACTARRGNASDEWAIQDLSMEHETALPPQDRPREQEATLQPATRYDAADQHAADVEDSCAVAAAMLAQHRQYRQPPSEGCTSPPEEPDVLARARRRAWAETAVTPAGPESTDEGLPVPVDDVESAWGEGIHVDVAVGRGLGRPVGGGGGRGVAVGRLSSPAVPRIRRRRQLRATTPERPVPLPEAARVERRTAGELGRARDGTCGGDDHRMRAPAPLAQFPTAAGRAAPPAPAATPAMPPPRPALQQLPDTTLRMWRALQAANQSNQPPPALSSPNPPAKAKAAATTDAIASGCDGIAAARSASPSPSSAGSAAERRERRRQRNAELRRVREWLEETRCRLHATEHKGGRQPLHWPAAREVGSEMGSVHGNGQGW